MAGEKPVRGLESPATLPKPRGWKLVQLGAVMTLQPHLRTQRGNEGPQWDFWRTSTSAGARLPFRFGQLREAVFINRGNPGILSEKDFDEKVGY